MPEGHTLHRLARDLDATFGGRRVVVSSPQGRFADSAALVDGAVVHRAEAAGKHLFVELGGDRVLHVHLGLIGSFDVHADVGELPLPVGQVRLRLASRDRAGTSYADLRGAIVCELVTPERRAEVIARLGPDPLRPDADPARAWARISRSQRPIGDLLLDQEVVAGVGNVYRAELLSGIACTRCGRVARSASGSGGRCGRTSSCSWGGGQDRHHRHGPPGAHARGDGPARARGRPRRGGLRLPPRRAGLPRVRHARAHRGAGWKESLLVCALSTALPVPRRTVNANDRTGSRP